MLINLRKMSHLKLLEKAIFFQKCFEFAKFTYRYQFVSIYTFFCKKKTLIMMKSFPFAQLSQDIT